METLKGDDDTERDMKKQQNINIAQVGFHGTTYGNLS